MVADQGQCKHVDQRCAFESDFPALDAKAVETRPCSRPETMGAASLYLKKKLPVVAISDRARISVVTWRVMGWPGPCATLLPGAK